MKAKCPHCEDGCSKCDNGFIDVKFATGFAFTIKCKDPDCGFENGMRIDDRPNFPDIVKPDITCVFCDSETEYVLIGYMK